MKYCLLTSLALLLAMPAHAQEEPALATDAAAPAERPASPAKETQSTLSESMVDEAVLDLIRSKINTELVIFMLKNQNEKYADVDNAKVTELDNQWVRERSEDSKPLISATLSNPLSTYLTMVQARSEGLFTEMFVMDNKGLNVGQSNISSDYWQGDEDKWQKTYLAGPDAVFIDAAEFDSDRQIWVSQANLSIADPDSGEVVGAVTVDINLTELQRRRANGVAL